MPAKLLSVQVVAILVVPVVWLRFLVRVLSAAICNSAT